MGVAVTEKTTFSRTTSINQVIDSDLTTVWEVLTDAPQYARWNSTIVSLEGQIKKGNKIQLKSTLDPKRTFKLKVKEMITNELLVWGDAMGQRTYKLSKTNGGVLFSMTEKIGGLLFPLFASKIPSFDQSFEDFTSDLQKECESRSKS